MTDHAEREELRQDVEWGNANPHLDPDTEMGRHVAKQIAARLTQQADEPITLTQGEIYTLLGQIRRERVWAYRMALASARARAAPSEDAIRAAKFEALSELRAYFEALDFRPKSPVLQAVAEFQKDYAPRPVYAAPVRLSDGSTFGQVGPDAFEWNAHVVHTGTAEHFLRFAFPPRDGALVLAVLDGAEATR